MLDLCLSIFLCWIYVEYKFSQFTVLIESTFKPAVSLRLVNTYVKPMLN